MQMLREAIKERVPETPPEAVAYTRRYLMTLSWNESVTNMTPSWNKEMPMPPPRKLSDEDILDAAQALLEAEGFGALSARRLAETLGASRQVAYTHFGGMDGLLQKLHRRGAQLLARDVAAVDAIQGSDGQISAIFSAYVAAARTRPALFSLLFGAPVPHYTPDRDTLLAARACFGHMVAAAAAWLAVRRGAEPPPPHVAWQDSHALDLARALWATAHGLIALEQAQHALSGDTDRLVEATAAAVLAGWH
ncbi:MAG: AcrR family transcriptional regulator [Myxococcota bacterium]|jgi:AcrR family transcriptional regulator